MSGAVSSDEASANMPSRALILAALLLANIALALGPTFVRMADTGPVAAAFWRMALAVPVLFVLAKAMKQPVRVESRTLWLPLLLSGLFFAGDLATWHIGILGTRLANATLFGNAASLFYPIWGFIIARSLPQRSQAFALLLGLAGALLLLGRSAELSSRNLVGDLFCLAAGTFYTFYFIAIARARESLPSWTLLVWSTLSTALPLLGIAWMLGEAILPGDWTPLIGLAVASQLVGQGLLVWVIDKVSPLQLGLALMTQPVVSAAIGVIGFGEVLGTADIAGAILVGVALVLVKR